MAEDFLLKGKKVLIVDDEADVLDSLEQLLPMCEVLKASTFQEGKTRLNPSTLILPFWISWVLTDMGFWRSRTVEKSLPSC